MSAIPIGEWVQACDSLEFDLSGRGAVGMLLGMRIIEGRKLYLVGENEEKPWGYYNHVRRITKTEGREVIKGWRERRTERYSRAIGEEGSIGDQIRRFLREEARQQKHDREEHSEGALS